ILKTNPLKKRDGFAMIMAILVILVISTIMALSLALTTQTGKRTTDLYLYEQAVLYSKSAAELALLDIAQNGCSDNFNTTFDGIYDANVTMRYIYTGAVGGCTNYFNINTPEQNGSVLMDITISVNDTTLASEPIRYFRRTIQKL
ncbi:MAG: hypothetical protein A3G74_02170, partial [Sulfurimonas sp. RIFCSPLOWO2_12_FULL_34_6]